MNPLQRLHEAGQSIWVDFLRRTFLTSGELSRLIREDAVSGITSNPTIFRRAVAESVDYEQPMQQLVEHGSRDPREIFYLMALGDIRAAADVLRPVYVQTRGHDGFVSFELEPRLAHDTPGSVSVARHLAEHIDKPNVMIKVPGTSEGILAVEELTAAGVNVNITLLFSVETYEDVAEAYLAGLEHRLAAGQQLDRVASVASFFVSRVDSAVDGLLPEGSPLRGQVAIANAKQAYQRFLSVFSGARWDRLARAGARVQRLLWASTGTKNPAYSDVRYVEELIGPSTVNTMPLSTLDAFRDHGRVRPLTILADLDEAEAVFLLLREHGIDLEDVAAGLLTDGLAGFAADMEKLLAAIAAKVKPARLRGQDTPTNLGTLAPTVAKRLDEAARNETASRIWSRDHTVWKPDATEIADRLGWLDLPETMPERTGALQAFVRQVRADGFTHALLLGMGGSSLAPEVYRRVLGVAPGGVDLTILDSTHPRAIAAVERSRDLEHTLVVVSSKSGATVETLCHCDYFFAKTGRGEQFVAITDPGSPLEALAQRRGFRAIFLNPPDVGGRYSALSVFGLLPAALIGADVAAILEAGAEMACACDRYVPSSENPALWLGALMGEAARAGRDKLTLMLGADLAPFGAWTEQLVAESTGKEGTGIVPVVDEELGEVGSYGHDRLFVALGDVDGLSDLAAAGHPVARLRVSGPERLGAEFFRWEFATAVAGHVLGVNPFDQPNVAEAKKAALHILKERRLDDPGLDDLKGPLGSLGRGDYLALLAYIDPTPANTDRLQHIRLAIRDRKHVATTLGFGPRYLHSTGQLHKGGPESGVFIQVVDETYELDLPIPGRSFSFGELLAAQALGDLLALRRLGRRVARTTLPALEEATATL